MVSKKAPGMHYSFLIVNFEASPRLDSLDVENLIFSPAIRSKNNFDLSSPPVVPIGVSTTSESRQNSEN